MSGIEAACSDCVRRSLLIGRLAPRIAGLLGEPPQRRTKGVLGLDCDAADRGPRAQRGASGDAQQWLEELDIDAVGDELHETGVEALCIHREPYPPALAATSDSPPVLWVLGGLRQLEDALSAPVVTVVGTRKPSPYGREMAYALGRDLAAAGVTVVSGLALGIDGAAHRGALDGRGQPDRGGGERPRHPVSAHEHRAMATAGRARGRGVGAAAGPPAVPVELSGAEPDHGRDC